MIIQSFESGPLATNAYVIGCPKTHLAAIIDPAEGSTPAIVDFLIKHHLKPEKILLTHSHWDHIADVAKLKAKYSVEVWIHPDDAANLEKPGSDTLPLWFSIEGVKPDGFFKDGDHITIGDIDFQVIHTSGHTPGGVCFYCADENVLFSGDTLFKGSIGNISFPTARVKVMWISLTKLSRLPSKTVVYPGHGESTTIGAEHWLSEAEKFFGH